MLGGEYNEKWLLSIYKQIQLLFLVRFYSILAAVCINYQPLTIYNIVHK